eukprot:500274-Rhodomonas_salina.1
MTPVAARQPDSELRPPGHGGSHALTGSPPVTVTVIRCQCTRANRAPDRIRRTEHSPAYRHLVTRAAAGNSREFPEDE